MKQSRCLPTSPENGNRSSFRIVVFCSFFFIPDDGQSLKKPVILSFIHDRQKPSYLLDHYSIAVQMRQLLRQLCAECNLNILLQASEKIISYVEDKSGVFVKLY
jgi:hypothetical protein